MKLTRHLFEIEGNAKEMAKDAGQTKFVKVNTPTVKVGGSLLEQFGQFFKVARRDVQMVEKRRSGKYKLRIKLACGRRKLIPS